MTTLNRLVCLFDKADLPVPTKRYDHDTHVHEYRPPRTKGVKDSRSPCPALNTLANHGYLYVFELSFNNGTRSEMIYGYLALGQVVTFDLISSFKPFKKGTTYHTLSQRS